MKRPIVIMALAGIIIRLILAPLFTYVYDASAWAVVIGNIESGSGLYGKEGYYYPPVWGYILDVVGIIFNVFHPGVMANVIDSASCVESYWWPYYTSYVTIPEFNLAVKIPLILSDLVVGYLIYHTAKKITLNEKKSVFAFCLWFFCPIVIYMSSVQAQFDTIAVLFLFVSILLARKRMQTLAGAFFMLAVMTKVIPIYLLFMLLAFILARSKLKIGLERFRELGMFLIGGAVTFLIVSLPMIINGEFSDMFLFLTSRLEYAIFATNKSSLGVFISIGFVLMVFLEMIIISLLIWLSYKFYKGKQSDRRLFLYLTVSSATAFLWPTEPQFLIIIIPFVAIYAAIYDRRFLLPWSIIGISAVIFALVMENGSLLLSISAYTNIIPMASVIDIMSWFNSTTFGLHNILILMIPAAIVQLIGTALIPMIYYRERNTNYEQDDVLS